MTGVPMNDVEPTVAPGERLRPEALEAIREVLAAALREPLDVDRLAKVLCHREHITGYVWCRRHKIQAEEIAALYATPSGDSRDIQS